MESAHAVHAELGKNRRGVAFARRAGRVLVGVGTLGLSELALMHWLPDMSCRERILRDLPAAGKVHTLVAWRPLQHQLSLVPEFLKVLRVARRVELSLEEHPGIIGYKLEESGPRKYLWALMAYDPTVLHQDKNGRDWLLSHTAHRRATTMTDLTGNLPTVDVTLEHSAAELQHRLQSGRGMLQFDEGLTAVLQQLDEDSRAEFARALEAQGKLPQQFASE